jgi:hypothetical protein
VQIYLLIKNVGEWHNCQYYINYCSENSEMHTLGIYDTNIGVQDQVFKVNDIVGTKYHIKYNCATTMIVVTYFPNLISRGPPKYVTAS